MISQEHDWDELASRLAWSLMVGLASAFLLLPLFASLAHGQPLDVEPEVVAFDLASVAVCATVLVLATEWLRSLVPSWQRGARADANALAAVDHFRSLPGADPAHVETLRKLAVATGGPGELAKSALRAVPVAFGIVAALLGWAPAVGDGSNPQMFGGVGAGLVASLFGGQIMSAVRSRLPGVRRAAIVTPDGDEKPLSTTTTQEYRLAKAAERDEP